ncbi:MAG: FMN-binding negative transcriptional regulator [Flavobacteriaceae bacterium]
MYPPPYHQSNDIQKMIAVIKQYPFAMLVSAKDGKPYTTHIPIIYNEASGRLVAHIDRQNPQVETLVDGTEVTVIFRGPDTYISPSVYSTEQLPTWNYIFVHVTGSIHLIHEAEAVKQTMIDMTAFLEGMQPKFELHKDNPKMDRMVPYIQAFDITITNWEGKFKLSQDKIPADYELAKAALIKNSKPGDKEFIEKIYTNLK